MVWATFGEHCGGQRGKGERPAQSGISMQPFAEGKKNTAGWHLGTGQHNLGLGHEVCSQSGWTDWQNDSWVLS